MLGWSWVYIIMIRVRCGVFIKEIEYWELKGKDCWSLNIKGSIDIYGFWRVKGEIRSYRFKYRVKKN